ncbi:MAG TPA: type II secretion system protein [Candidatus Limnocylindrales bacterium]|nr:type II secretion system protein [Candidatus Limnocylindrales bacterium]
MTYKTKQQGFTIVELLIVIVVIGILAALVITTFTGIQQKARDTERTTDIKALHGQIEAYYASKQHYPSLTDMNSSSWRTSNMKGLDQEALKDPKGNSYDLVDTTTAGRYVYHVTNDSDSSCEADDNTCTKYTLTSTNEGTPPTFSKSNLN